MQLVSNLQRYIIACALYIISTHIPCQAITMPTIEKKHIMVMGITGLAIMGCAYKWYRNNTNNTNRPLNRNIPRMPGGKHDKREEHKAREAQNHRFNYLF